jgi:hypothetical protein
MLLKELKLWQEAPERLDMGGFESLSYKDFPMNNFSAEDSKIVVHIHEHLSPLRDRLSRLEATSAMHSEHITSIRADIKGLNDKIDNNHQAQLKYIHSIKDDMLEAFKDHDEKDHEAFQEFLKYFELHKQDFEKMKWMILGGVGAITTTFGIVLVVLQNWKYVSP